MPGHLAPEVVRKFCELCAWAHEVWEHHEELFQAPTSKHLQEHKLIGPFLSRLSVVSQEYALLQLAKLHDPPISMGRVSLTIGYVVEYGGWSTSTQQRLEHLRGELDSFGAQLKVARNRALAHYDLLANMSDEPLGSFQAGDDRKYFSRLQELVNVVHNEAIGGPFPFDSFVQADVAGFIHALGLDDQKGLPSQLRRANASENLPEM